MWLRIYCFRNRVLCFFLGRDEKFLKKMKKLVTESWSESNLRVVTPIRALRKLTGWILFISDH